MKTFNSRNTNDFFELKKSSEKYVNRILNLLGATLNSKADINKQRAYK